MEGHTARSGSEGSCTQEGWLLLRREALLLAACLLTEYLEQVLGSARQSRIRRLTSPGARASSPSNSATETPRMRAACRTNSTDGLLARRSYSIIFRVGSSRSASSVCHQPLAMGATASRLFHPAALSSCGPYHYAACHYAALPCVSACDSRHPPANLPTRKQTPLQPCSRT
jgi:hypothetical protein